MKYNVSVIVPCRNEAAYISGFLDSLLGQSREGFELEVVIADGGSADGTLAILNAAKQKNPMLKIIDNPAGIVSTGLNAAAQSATGDILVRMDVHTQYENDYIQQCVATLISKAAACVGGPWKAAGKSSKQIAIANAFQSPIGSGGALSRKLDYEGPAETVYLGCWWRKDFLAIGGFDETLVRNQDDELCLRLKLAGKSIWQSAKIRSTYFPRTLFRHLYRQFFQYGYWKVAVAVKHGQHAALRHLVPFFFVLSIIVLTLVGCFHWLGFAALAAELLLYGSLVLASAISVSRQSGFLPAIQVATAIATTHFGYGLGYALGLRDFMLVGGKPRKAMQKLTR